MTLKSTSQVRLYSDDRLYLLTFLKMYSTTQTWQTSILAGLILGFTLILILSTLAN